MNEEVAQIEVEKAQLTLCYLNDKATRMIRANEEAADSFSQQEIDDAVYAMNMADADLRIAKLKLTKEK
jgi:hypothetical protein